MPLVPFLSVLFFFQFDEAKLQREYHYKHWQNNQLGLVSNRIMTIGQDPFGYIWIGTFSGLQRFDGHRFETLKILEDPVRGLSSSQVIKIFTDRRGFVWIGTYDKGLNRLDPRSLEVVRFVNDPQDATSLSNNRISAIAQDGKGNLWIATISGLNHLNSETLEISRYFFKGSPTNRYDPNFLTSVFVDQTDTVWVGSYMGVLKYQADVDQFQFVTINRAAENRLKKLNITDMMETESGSLLLATLGDGMLELDKDGSGQLAQWQGPNVFCLLGDDTGRFWRGLYNEGLQVYDPQSTRHFAPLSSRDGPHSLHKKSVLSLFEDKSGTLWIGTDENGLYRFNPKTAAFNHLTLAPGNTTKDDKTVYAMGSGHGDHFWVGTEGGKVFAIDRETFEKKILLTGDERAPIQALTEDHRGRVWVGYRRQGLLRIDPRTGARQRFLADQKDPTSLSSNAVNAVVEDPQGSIWVGTGNGLNRFLPMENGFQRFEQTAGSPNGLENEVIYALLADRGGQLWLANSYGEIHVLDSQHQRFKKIIVSDQKGLDAFDFRVNALCESSGGDIFAGVIGDGIKRINAQTHEVTPLPGGPKFIMALVEDGQGHLWASSLDAGLFRFDLSAGTVVRYGLEQGIQALSFSKGAGSRLNNGDLIFGGINGLNIFSPQRVSVSSDPPFVFIKNLLAFGEPVAGFSMDPLQEVAMVANETLYLPHWQNTLTVEFRGLHVPNPENNRYEHKLEPLDRTWIPLTAAQRELTFYNLGPGNYRFALRAANGDSGWTPNPKHLAFVIKPPFWKTQMALFAYFILGIGGVWFWIWWRTTRLRKRAITLESQVVTRTREIQEQKDTIESLLDRQKTLFSNISHEFRTPLTLILGLLNRMLRRGNDPSPDRLKTVRSNALKLLRMVDQILDLSRLANSGVSPSSPMDATKALGLLLNAFDGALKARSLQLETALTKACWIEMHPDSFEKIVLNLLSNAIKYTDEGGTICVTLAPADSEVVLAIEDTGMGIPEGDLAHIFDRFYRSDTHQQQRIVGAGIGLAIVKELTELSGGAIEVTSQVAVGTIFTLRFPTCSPAKTPVKSRTSPPLESSVEMELNALTQAPPLATIEEKPKETNRASLLIIEDNEAMRAYIQSELAETYHCHTANDGKAGITAAQRLIPDLIISDIMMPGMDGYQVTHALKSHGKTSHIPVILLTARGDQESLISGIREGADAYVTKPFNTQELTYRIENLLAVREILKKRYAAEFFSDGASIAEAGDAHSPLDVAFLEKFQQLLADNFQDPAFGLKEMIHAMAMSERPLQRKLKALTDHTPSQFLRIYRLKRATTLLHLGQKSSDVAFKVGFSSHAYFSACFKAHFSVSPSTYALKS